MKASQVRKAIVAFVIGISAWAAAALVDGKVSPAEWAQLIGVFAVTFGTYMVPNAPAEPPVETPEVPPIP